MPRHRFSEQVAAGLRQTSPKWKFEPLYWNELPKLKPIKT
jgi:hypothetical protein